MAQEPTFEIVVPEGLQAGVYANFLSVWHSHEAWHPEPLIALLGRLGNSKVEREFVTRQEVSHRGLTRALSPGSRLQSMARKSGNGEGGKG